MGATKCVSTDTLCRATREHAGMTHATCTPLQLARSKHTLIGYSHGLIERIDQQAPSLNRPIQLYQFASTAVQWLLATPNETLLIAGHDDGFVVVFSASTGKELPHYSCQMQSEYRSTMAHTQGELSANGRWLFIACRKETLDVGVLIDLHGQRPHRRLLMLPATLTQPRFDMQLDRMWVVTREGDMRSVGLSNAVVDTHSGSGLNLGVAFLTRSRSSC
jgi:hypothetical protein